MTDPVLAPDPLRLDPDSWMDADDRDYWPDWVEIGLVAILFFGVLFAVGVLVVTVLFP